MSVLERRVQILIEREQYARLEKAASGESRSVASVIREAITAYLDGGADSRKIALDALLGLPPEEGQGEDWAVSKQRLESATASFG